MPALEAGFFMPQLKALIVQVGEFALPTAWKWGGVVENGVKGSKVGN